jgi:hypothetical protein
VAPGSPSIGSDAGGAVVDVVVDGADAAGWSSSRHGCTMSRTANPATTTTASATRRRRRRVGAVSGAISGAPSGGSVPVTVSRTR